MSRRLPWLDMAVTVLATVLIGVSLHGGWTRMETDFPNYYTGAVAATHKLCVIRFYDWTWFQREMNHAGFERQLGAYTPQTPLALLPFLPLSGFPPQRAKQVWLLANLVCLLLLFDYWQSRPVSLTAGCF